MHQVPVMDTGNGKSGQDFIHKHVPDILNRLLTEIKGAPFVNKLSGTGKPNKKTSQGSDQPSGSGAVDVSELLHPKKKARKAAKAKAKSKIGVTDGVAAEEVDLEVFVEGATRPRWWVDDLIGCLQHAAGGLLLK